MNIKSLVKSIFGQNTLLYIKYIKQKFNQLISKRKNLITDKDFQIVSEKDAHTFFGYYDISPFNIETSEFVYLKLKKNADKVDIFLSSTDDIKKTIKLTESYAWNWQQGSRLRWMPNNNRLIFFNDYDNGYCSKLFHVDTFEISKLPLPLYDISPDGKYGLSLNFERLGVKRPGYGYTVNPYIEDVSTLRDEGIDLYNFETNTIDRIITYEHINNSLTQISENFSENYLNHISFSPDGDKFLFFWLTSYRGFDKASLLVYDFKSKTIISLEEQEKVSHYVWIDNDNILCTTIDNTLSSKYYIYSISKRSKELINSKCLYKDGHPTIYSDNVILTDTYPDSNGFQRLFFADIKGDNSKEILSIYSDCRITGEKRTDLHPRLNNDKSLICFDANINGYRNLYLMKI